MAVLTASIRPLLGLWCCLALAALAGCRNLDNAQTDVLERELRQQEDYIYELEDYLVEYSEKLRQARMAQCATVSTTSKSGSSSSPKAPLREPTLDVDPVKRPSLPLNGRNKPVPAPAATSEAPPASDATAPELPAVQPPEDVAPEPEAVSPEEMEAPALEIGPGVGALRWKGNQTTEPLMIPDPVDYQADAETQPAAVDQTQAVAESPSEPHLAAPQVNGPRLSAERLKIRRVFAEPTEDGQSPGSLLVVVEALNATDEPVDAIGAASLMIMVQDAPGSLKRIERWDFTAEETAAAWQSSNLGDGLHLELPLAKGELPEGKLELWARVVNEDGAKLLTPADEAYRFEANQLALMADAAEEPVLASTEQPDATLGTTEATGATEATTAEAAPKPQWRASAVSLDKDRVEGFATTAGGNGGKGAWTTKPIDAAQPRIASNTATNKGARPAWKRSASAAAATESRPNWSAER